MYELHSPSVRSADLTLCDWIRVATMPVAHCQFGISMFAFEYAYYAWTKGSFFCLSAKNYAISSYFFGNYRDMVNSAYIVCL